MSNTRPKPAHPRLQPNSARRFERPKSGLEGCISGPAKHDYHGGNGVHSYRDSTGAGNDVSAAVNSAGVASGRLPRISDHGVVTDDSQRGSSNSRNSSSRLGNPQPPDPIFNHYAYQTLLHHRDDLLRRVTALEDTLRVNGQQLKKTCTQRDRYRDKLAESSAELESLRANREHAHQTTVHELEERLAHESEARRIAEATSIALGRQLNALCKRAELASVYGKAAAATSRKPSLYADSRRCSNAAASLSGPPKSFAGHPPPLAADVAHRLPRRTSIQGTSVLPSSPSKSGPSAKHTSSKPAQLMNILSAIALA
ncbi:hypothetical protein SeMB42_g01689 [Synchytrium endobioticum]|uniref:Uncharacterized protein n=1 Tax=Synchytrium endobioticum TaxID=286115 RepID=A0A507DMC4_9FUNG|nr:hypothetical protein SeLEV6574_g03757 [Synchytrium endobioticum]TPX52040.1 hypothetical protein SeMB42_g01689 [Synchytrium endobioticum]